MYQILFFNIVVVLKPVTLLTLSCIILWNGQTRKILKVCLAILQYYVWKVKKSTLVLVFFCEFCEIFKNTFGGCFWLIEIHTNMKKKF